MVSVATAGTAVDIDEVDPHLLPPGQGGHDRAQRAGRATLASDDLAHVVGVDADLQRVHAPSVEIGDDHVVGVADQTLDQVFQRVGQHDQASAEASASSEASVAFLRFEIAPAAGASSASARAALKRATLSTFSG